MISSTLVFPPPFHCLIWLGGSNYAEWEWWQILFLILEDQFSFPSRCLTLVIGLPYRSFVVFVFSRIFIFLVFFCHEGILNVVKLLFVSIDDHVYVLEPIHEMHCIYWLEFAKLFLSQNSLVTLFCFFNVLLRSFCNYFI